jgi:hypothetical protein
MSRVRFEHKDGSAEGRLRASLGSKEIPCVLHGGDIVFLKIQRETGVDEAVFLAWSSVDINLSPFGQVTVVTRFGTNGKGLEVMEGLGDFGVDGLDALLNKPEKDDRLQLLDIKRRGYS